MSYADGKVFGVECRQAGSVEGELRGIVFQLLFMVDLPDHGPLVFLGSIGDLDLALLDFVEPGAQGT